MGVQVLVNAPRSWRREPKGSTPCLAPLLPPLLPCPLLLPQMGVQVLVNDPKELEAIRDRELDITKERIQKILDAGGLEGLWDWTKGQELTP